MGWAPEDIGAIVDEVVQQSSERVVLEAVARRYLHRADNRGRSLGPIETDGLG